MSCAHFHYTKSDLYTDDPPIGHNRVLIVWIVQNFIFISDVLNHIDSYMFSSNGYGSPSTSFMDMFFDQS